MEKELFKAIDVVEELDLYLKMVVSTRIFDNYNSFFNIYGESEEPCRRILVITKFKDLEEVNDENSFKPIEKYKIIDGNMWLEEYSLTFNPEKINLEEIFISKEAYEALKSEV